MRSTVIVFAAITAGIALAWVAFAPSPEPLPDLPVAGARPPAAEGPVDAPPKVVNPVNEAFHARINQPDAQLAGMQGSVWSVIRRDLSQQGTPEATALLEEANDLIRDLREARLRADSADFDALDARQKALREKLSDVRSPVIDAQVKRLDDLATAYASGGSLSAQMPSRPIVPGQAGATGSRPVGEGNLPPGPNGNLDLPPDFVPPPPPKPREPEEVDVVDPSSPLGIPWAEEGDLFGQ